MLTEKHHLVRTLGLIVIGAIDARGASASMVAVFCRGSFAPKLLMYVCDAMRRDFP